MWLMDLVVAHYHKKQELKRIREPEAGTMKESCLVDCSSICSACISYIDVAHPT